ncbi:putative E3 ubiquitin-protein ligase SINAT5-like [Capsicum annuum]|nr:putative E3 ubiquitin-protein ligase SINAT5-like [Capsicum annuum]
MNFLTISNTSSILHPLQTSSPKFIISIWRKRTPSPHNSNICNNPISPFSNPSRFKISAQFGRRTKRRNYLRKKLTQHLQQQRQQQVVQNPILDNPTSSESLQFGPENADGEKSKNLVSDTEESKGLGESVLWNKLESWVEQYKKDTEFWGIGTAPIFTVFQDSEGKVERVVVNEDEILNRSRIDPTLYRKGLIEEDEDVKEKISLAVVLAREMESGKDLLPKNSSVAKFVVSGEESNNAVSRLSTVTLNPNVYKKLPRIGFVVFCGFFLVWTVKKMFVVRNDGEEEYSRLEKEMLRRKMKARKEKEKAVKGEVEVIHGMEEPDNMTLERPWLDKQGIMSSIKKAREFDGKLALSEQFQNQHFENAEFYDEIAEIRKMARNAREQEKGNSLQADNGGESGDYPASTELSNEKVVAEQNLFEDSNEQHDLNVYVGDIGVLNGFVGPTAYSDDNGVHTNASSLVNHEMQTSNGNLLPSDDIKNCMENSSEPKHDVISTHGTEKPTITSEQSRKPSKFSVTSKSKIILSVQEAREYLSKKNEKLKTKQERTPESDPGVENVSIPLMEKESINDMNQLSDNVGKEFDPLLSGTSDFIYENSSFKQKEFFPTSKSAVATLNQMKSYQSLCSDDDENNSYEELKPLDLSPPEHEAAVGEVFAANEIPERIDKVSPLTKIPETHSHQAVNGRTTELEPSPNNGSWLEKNFHEFDPVIKKIQMGFRDNYSVAKEKSFEELNLKTQMFHPETDGNVTELEWMKDERLYEIVFKVRENELAGRDPFYQMDDEDKLAFFSGLEKKVDQENKQLQDLHEWLHSNIENLDYGADGISLYDPPEKIIPRWKGPPLEGSSEFLNYFVEQRKVVAESIKDSNLIKKERQELPQGLQISPSSNKNDSTSAISTHNAKAKTPRTIIESSDGSIKAGKKSGREYWQHTKKWSQGFLESYNAETDPETKALMKDVGKDLDRWITEREIKEAADLMDNLPEKGKKLIKEKLDKVKREMELFGPQAVVSKYREYADEKEEDYLWWLDLSCVLCIELYTEEEGEMKVGFYSLEMAADLELDPKQYHVIAFEDAGDCKNLCYIIQAYMEMLGNGNAFVVARPPKDAYRDAKANGFNVTVIKKGQLQLNIDQSLEEVEEAITDIGSKIYHDKIMRERSLDVSTVMKGLFDTGKPMKKRYAATIRLSPYFIAGAPFLVTSMMLSFSRH